MRKHLETYSAFDIVVVPFPFIDGPLAKRRSAVVLSSATCFNSIADASVLAMITSSKQIDWPLDTPINDIRAAGLTHPCHIRMKLFTLDHRLIIKKVGTLAKNDQDAIKNALKELLCN